MTSVNMYATEVLVLLFCLFLLLLFFFLFFFSLFFFAIVVVLGGLCAFYSFGSLEGAAMLVRALPMRSRKRLPLPTDKQCRLRRCYACRPFLRSSNVDVYKQPYHESTVKLPWVYLF